MRAKYSWLVDWLAGSVRMERKLQLPLKYLKDITDNFSSDRKIGEGGFGVVYKGIDVESGVVIAVKKLRPIVGEQDKQFKNEANHLAGVNHQNVVKLIGYCDETKGVPMYDENRQKYIVAEKQQKLLCYEYLSNGSLDSIIFDESLGLDWQSRYKIIVGICQGLHYLHEGQDTSPIVHMDLKPSNILLDDRMEPKIADFGLSRLFSEEQSLTCTKNVMGSIGYMAPEYLHRGEISTKSDIYSLGILILEIITGMKNHQAKGNNSGEQFMEDVRKNWTLISQISSKHPSLGADCLQQVHRCINIGLCCVEADKERRPSAGQMLSLVLSAGGCTHKVDQPGPNWALDDGQRRPAKLRCLPKRLCDPVVPSTLLPNKTDLTLEGERVVFPKSVNTKSSWLSAEMISKLGIGVVALVLVLFNLNNSFSWVVTALHFIVTARATAFAIGVVQSVALFLPNLSSLWSSAVMTFKLATALRTLFFAGIVVLVLILYLHISSLWRRVLFAAGAVLAAVLILLNANCPWSCVVLTLKFVTVLVTSSAIAVMVVVLILCLLNPSNLWRRRVVLFFIGGVVLSAAIFLLNPSGSWSWLILTLKFFRTLLTSFALRIMVAVLVILVLRNASNPWSWAVMIMKVFRTLVIVYTTGIVLVHLVLYLLNLSGSRRLVILGLV